MCLCPNVCRSSFQANLILFVPTQELQTYPQSPSIVIIFYLIYYDFYIGLLTFFASKKTYELSYNVCLTQGVQIMSVSDCPERFDPFTVPQKHNLQHTRSYLINSTALAPSLL